MICGGHVCALYVVTAGQQGPSLGSDEEEIVLLIYIVIDVVANKIIGVQQYLVRPTRALLAPAPAPDAAGAVAPVPVAPSPLSREVTEATGITEDMLEAAGQPLEVVIEMFDNYVKSLQLDPNSPLFRLVTDGQPPLRQCVHPEACSKDLALPGYYTRFHDLRKEFCRSYTHRAMDPASAPPGPPPATGAPPLAPLTPLEASNSIPEMLNYLGLPPYSGDSYYLKAAKDMSNIIQRIISDGFRLELPETVDLILETGICSKEDDIDGNCIVRARGLPWQSSDQDIAKFFRGLNVSKGGVALCLSSQGRRNGEALIRFVSMEHRDMALKRHRHHLNKRYIEVYRATGEDFLSVAGGATSEATAFLTRGAQVIIRMRGLPYDCTAQQVLDFFSAGKDPCAVLDSTEGVLFVHRFDGRATGDAFVLFALEDDAPKALSRHRNLIGSRYIELFRSTIAEVQQVLNRALEPKPAPPPPQVTVGSVLGNAQTPDPTTHGFSLGLGAVPLLPQHVITSGTLKDCVRLRGLPYEAQVEHILKFLDDFAKNIVFQGVHMVYNAQGQPNGEAFIQMDSETSAFLCAQQKHHRFMTFCKKQRYIEVFQCSGEDMNLVQTGGLSSPGVWPGVGKVLPSPPGLTFGGSFGVRYAGGPAPAPPPPSQGPAGPLLYWGYPSPPVSPAHYYHPHAALHQPHHTVIPEVIQINGTSSLPTPYDHHQPLPLFQGGIPGLPAPPPPGHLTPLNLNPLTMELYMVN